MQRSSPVAGPLPSSAPLNGGSPEILIFRSNGVQIRPAEGVVRRDGADVYLRARSFQVLVYLIDHCDRVVSKDELIAEFWKETAVTDDALVQCIGDARKALGDDPRQPRFIKTIHKSGYRYIAPVETLTADPRAALDADLDAETEPEASFDVGRTAGEATAPPASDPQMGALSPRTVGPRPWVLAAGFLILAVGLTVVLLRPELSRELSALVASDAPRISVAVLPFENRSGDADLDWWREGVADMLITGLTRSSRLEVISRQHVVELQQRGDDGARSSESVEAARRLAQRAHAGVVVFGSFARSGTRIRIDTQILDGKAGTVIAAESATLDSPDALLGEVDLLAAKLGAHFGADAPRPSPGSIADAMTPSIEAYRYYSMGVQKASNLHNTDAIALLEKAVALDPYFAMAHARIGFTYVVSWGYLDKGKPYLDKAFTLADRLTEKDRLNIVAWRAIADKDYEGAIRTLREVTVKYPRDVEAYLSLGNVLTGESKFDEARTTYQDALAIDPDSPELYNRLSSLYQEVGKPHEALAMAQRYVALAPDEANAHDTLGIRYGWLGLYEQAEESFGKALALKADFDIAVVHLGNLLFQSGRYRDALVTYERYGALVTADGDRRRGFGCLFWTHLARGDRYAAKRAAAQAEGALPSSWEELWLAFDEGRLDEAARRKGDFFKPAPYSHRGRRVSGRTEEYPRGYVAFREGQTDQALGHFKAALSAGPFDWAQFSHEDALANAYLELGRLDDAIAEYRRILAINPRFPLASYRLAYAYERKGLAGEARAEYTRFLETWRRADRDVPEVLDARRRLTALERGDQAAGGNRPASLLPLSSTLRLSH